MASAKPIITPAWRATPPRRCSRSKTRLPVSAEPRLERSPALPRASINSPFTIGAGPLGATPAMRASNPPRDSRPVQQ